MVTGAWIRPTCDTGSCPEIYISSLRDGVMLRSTRNPEQMVVYTMDEWRALVTAIRAGEFE